MSSFDTTLSDAGRAIWIEATDGTTVNALSVQFFVVREDNLVTPLGSVVRWGVTAEWADGFVTLRRYDTEEEAGMGLLRLRRLLPGQHISADLYLDPDEEAA